MSSAPTNPRASIRTYYHAPPDQSPGAPAVVVQITSLVDSYMIWAGTCEEIPGAENLETAESGWKVALTPQEGETVSPPPKSSLEDAEENLALDSDGVRRQVLGAVRQGRLASDWACAMPSANPSIPNPATCLFRSGQSDVSLAMARRLAQRFKKQILLSVDLSSSPEEGSRMGLLLEKRVLDSLKRVEALPTV